jgi:hypothetical protein
MEDYPDGNPETSWKRLKNKYKSIYSPSSIEVEKQFRGITLKKSVLN